jgi:O-antigen/teichoic acid export membrane protein
VSAAHNKEMAKGAGIYFLGLPGKFAGFLFIWVSARYYPESELGVYLAAWALLQVFLRFVAGGLGEGLSLRVASLIPPEKRKERDSRPAEVYKIFSTAVYLGLLLSALSIGGIWSLTGLLREWKLIHFSGEIETALLYLSLIIPVHLLTHLAVSATRGILQVQYDVWINSFARQTLLLVLTIAAIAWQGWDYRLVSLQLGVHFISLIIALKGLSRWFDISKVFRIQKWDKEFLSFCLPLTLNDILFYLTQELDLIMLTLYGVVSNEKIAFYGVAISIVFGIRMLRRNFMKVFVPLASGHLQTGDWSKVNDNFSSVLRWTLYLALPLFSLFTLFPDSILSLYNSSYLEWKSTFMILALGAFINTVVGSYGFLLFSLERTRMVLMNNAINVVLNALLNFILIPRWGLLGAGVATTVSMVITHIVIIIEIRILSPQLKLDLSAIRYPLLVFLLPYILVLVLASFLGENIGEAGLIAVYIATSALGFKAVGLHQHDRELVGQLAIVKRLIK